MRKIVISIVGLTLLVASYYTKEYLADSKKSPKQRDKKIVKTVFVETVTNKTFPIIINESGSLVAKNKVQLYSEVQGVLEVSKKDFRIGVGFNKGEILLKINNDEHFSRLQSQKSSLQNLIVSVMPDLQLDYPESFSSWSSYLKEFDTNTELKDFPKPVSEREKYFIIGKNIYNKYYEVQNLEARLDKYTLKAPFKGILTEVFVTNGSLVRPGQKLGEFISQDIFELQLSVNASLANSLKTGKIVKLYPINGEYSWKGKVARINGKIDLDSQTVEIFVEVKGKDLKEGMYLEAFITAKDVENSYKISRKLLVNNKAVYILKKDVLELVNIKPIYFDENTVIVKGITDGTQLISKPVPGAFSGMLVKVYKDHNSQDEL